MHSYNTFLQATLQYRMLVENQTCESTLLKCAKRASIYRKLRRNSDPSLVLVVGGGNSLKMENLDDVIQHMLSQRKLSNSSLKVCVHQKRSNWLGWMWPRWRKYFLHHTRCHFTVNFLFGTSEFTLPLVIWVSVYHFRCRCFALTNTHYLTIPLLRQWVCFTSDKTSSLQYGDKPTKANLR